MVVETLPKAINAHLINKQYVSYAMAMKIHKYYRRHEDSRPHRVRTLIIRKGLVKV